MWQNSKCDKTQNVRKLKNSKCDKTQKFKILENSKTKNMTKLNKNQYATKLKKKSNCDKNY